MCVACKKQPGPGGRATIQGYVHITEWNLTFTAIQGYYMGGDFDVYIIYGNDSTYSDHVKTNPNGLYEIKYLRPGKYKVYAYSDEPGVPNKKAIIKDVIISKPNETIMADTIELNHK